MTAHIAGLPLEELVAGAAGAGAALAGARVWLAARLSRSR